MINHVKPPCAPWFIHDIPITAPKIRWPGKNPRQVKAINDPFMEPRFQAFAGSIQHQWQGKKPGDVFFGSSLMFSDRILNLNSTIVYRCILQRTTEKLPMRITGLALGHSVWYPHGYRSHLFCPDMDVLCCSRWPASRWTYGNQYLDVYPSSKVGNSHIIPQQFRWVIQNPPTKIEKAS